MNQSINAAHLSLTFPGNPPFILRVKDSKYSGHVSLSFVEVGLEHVLNIEGVGCDDAVDFSGTAEDSGVGGTAAEDFRRPIEEAVAVFEEIWESSDQWVDFETSIYSWFGFSPESEDGDAKREEEDE
ncbi:hypothetical protein U1Q18_007984 [Sarracenia purpurea var. burkii]